MVLELPKIDPSAAEFSRLRGKIWCRRKSAEKKFGWPKIRRKKKQNSAAAKFFYGRFSAAAQKMQLRRLARVGVANNRLKSYRMIDYSHHM